MLCGGEILIVLFAAKITDSFENRSVLEKTAVEIRDYVDSLDYRKFKPPSKDVLFGKCGYAAKAITKELSQSFDENIIVYYLPTWFHIVSVLGNNFAEGWKIDPTIEQFGYVKNKNKLIFAPYEEYPLIITRTNHPFRKIHVETPVAVYDNYFTK